MTHFKDGRPRTADSGRYLNLDILEEAIVAGYDFEGRTKDEG